MTPARILLAGLVLALAATAAESRTTVLFIGNSFVYSHGSPVRFYRSGSVTDLNGEGIGGVPALVKSFAQQAGIDYDVFLETRGGAGLDFHLDRKLAVIGTHPWDKVVMHGVSVLDFAKPRDPAKLIDTSRRMAGFLRTLNPKVDVYLMATWSRADETYPPRGAWAGQPIEAMARDVRAAYDKAAAASGAKAVIPVGEAWTRAMHAGVADPNPYDGIEPGKLDLWASDHYHASTYGAYLEALVVFGTLTGRDPRSLGESECSAFELGLWPWEVKALQQVAFDQLASARAITQEPGPPPRPAKPVRCVAASAK